MPEARIHRLQIALTAVMAALFCAPASAPGKALDPSKTASRDFWEPRPERVRVELVKVPGSQRIDLAITTANTPGRTGWLSRDPLGERGGLNLYGFVGNDPVNNIDYLGMAPQSLAEKRSQLRELQALLMSKFNYVLAEQEIGRPISLDTLDEYNQWLSVREPYNHKVWTAEVLLGLQQTIDQLRPSYVRSLQYVNVNSHSDGMRRALTEAVPGSTEWNRLHRKVDEIAKDRKSRQTTMNMVLGLGLVLVDIADFPSGEGLVGAAALRGSAGHLARRESAERFLRSEMSDVPSAPETGTVPYYRVQGGTGTTTSKQLINADNGTATFTQGTNLNVSVGNLEHAKYFQTLRPGSNIVEVQVPKWFDDLVQESAISQDFYWKNARNQGGLAPKITDTGTPGLSLELPPIWSQWLDELSLPARVIE